MILAPPRFPRPSRPHRSLRTPPVPGINHAVGFSARYRMSAARSSSSINLSMRRMNSGVSTTVTSGSVATPQCSALDYLSSRCGGKPAGKPGRSSIANRRNAQDRSWRGTSKIGRKLYCVVKIEPTKTRHFRRSLRARPSLDEGRVLAHRTLADGCAARKVDQSAAQKVDHLEGGSFYADLTATTRTTDLLLRSSGQREPAVSRRAPAASCGDERVDVSQRVSTDHAGGSRPRRFRMR